MLMTPAQAAELTINQVVGLSAEEYAEYQAHERIAQVDYVLAVGELADDVLLADDRVREEWAAVYRLAEVKGQLGDVSVAVDVDVTASPDQECRIEVGTLKIQVGSCSERFPVVLECVAGAEDVLDRKVMRFVGRVCR